MRAAHETREVAGRRAGGYWTAAADRCLSIVTSIQYCRLGGLELSHSERSPLGCLDAFPLAQPEPRRHGWTRPVTTCTNSTVRARLKRLGRGPLPPSVACVGGVCTDAQPVGFWNNSRAGCKAFPPAMWHRLHASTVRRQDFIDHVGGAATAAGGRRPQAAARRLRRLSVALPPHPPPLLDARRQAHRSRGLATTDGWASSPTLPPPPLLTRGELAPPGARGRRGSPPPWRSTGTCPSTTGGDAAWRGWQ